jgi:hypothetical protein
MRISSGIHQSRHGVYYFHHRLIWKPNQGLGIPAESLIKPPKAIAA